MYVYGVRTMRIGSMNLSFFFIYVFRFPIIYLVGHHKRARFMIIINAEKEWRNWVLTHKNSGIGVAESGTGTTVECDRALRKHQQFLFRFRSAWPVANAYRIMHKDDDDFSFKYQRSNMLNRMIFLRNFV